MTSLVDAVFILLFFFLLALQPGQPLQVPLTLATTGAASPSGTVVEVLGRGRLSVQGIEFPLAALAASIPPTGPLALRAGPAARLQDLLDALDEARLAGRTASLAP